jgi:gluconokinase
MVSHFKSPECTLTGQSSLARTGSRIDEILRSKNVSCAERSEFVSSGMTQKYPTIIPGLRGPSVQVNGLVYFGRLLDKIRLHARGQLPQAWEAMRGTPSPNTFDARCCRFLQIDYAALEAEALKGVTDEELLGWAYRNGRKPSEEEIEVWNAFMTKRGWRDAGTQRLHERLAELGLPPGAVETMFDFIDVDEGRLQPKTA